MGSGITSIIFDYGGVISFNQSIDNIKKICSILNISINQYRSVYSTGRKEYDAGIIEARTYWNNIQNELKIDKIITDEEFMEIVKNDVNGWVNYNTKTIDLIKKLHKKYRLAILSNMNNETLHYIKNNAEWLNYFSSAIFSCEVNYSKPDSRIYEILLDDLNEIPEKTIFIDDTLSNVEFAQSIGINSILFKNNDELIRELNDIYRLGI